MQTFFHIAFRDLFCMPRGHMSEAFFGGAWTCTGKLRLRENDHTKSDVPPNKLHDCEDDSYRLSIALLNSQQILIGIGQWPQH